ncbi:MAG TPA: hypothetical protein VLV54_21280 [Thermoanaerobaculia bacterium]|nr:hypothetical protein [Thermoanaerobaculia bacterium]
MTLITPTLFSRPLPPPTPGEEGAKQVDDLQCVPPLPVWGVGRGRERGPGGEGPARRAAFLLLLLLALSATPALAQPSPVTVSLSPNGITVGDPARAVVSVTARTADLSGEPRFPIWGSAWGEAEIIEKDAPLKTGERDGIATWQQTLTLRAFRTGSVPLPPVAVEVPVKQGTLKLQTPAGLALAVRSVIPPEEKNPVPKPPAAMRPLAIGAPFWWTLGALSALALAGLWLLRRRPKAAGAGAPEIPALPPFEELAAELDRMAAEPSMLSLHIRLSLALRRYLGRRLPFPAVESTTSEIQRQLLSRRLPGPVARPAVELLRGCDLVKFARQDVDPQRGQERLATARRLAGDLEVHLAPREPEALVGKLEAAG